MSIVCAFLVTLIHCRPPFAFGSFAWWIKQMLEGGICTIAVPFFFLVSGFLLARHIGEKGWYLRENKKRLKSIVLPYFIWSTLFFICYGALRNFTFPINNLLEFYGLHYAWMPKLTALWYLRGLVVLVLLSPLLVIYLKMRWAGLILLFLCYGFVCPGPKGDGFIYALTRCGIFPMAGIFYFTLGLFIGRNKIQFKVTKNISLVCLFIGLLFSFMQALFYYQGLTIWMQYWGWLAIPLTMLGIWGLTPSTKWPKWLVTSSFPVYLIHKFFFPHRIVEYVTNNGGGIILCCLVASVVFILSIGVTLVIRTLMPKRSSLLFGGR